MIAAAVLVAGALRSELRWLALAVGVASNVSFLWMFAGDSSVVRPLGRGALADAITSSLLLVAAGLWR